MTQYHKTKQGTYIYSDDGAIISFQPTGDLATLNIVIPARINNINIHRIEDHAFASCNLESIKLPNQIKSIGQHAFANNFLTAIDIPQDCRTIDNYAFSNNVLERVTINPKLERIGEYAFAQNDLTQLPMLMNQHHASLRFETGAFRENALTDIQAMNIPKCMKDLPNECFSHNQIRSIQLPSHVRTIGEKAFYKNPIQKVIHYNTTVHNYDTTLTPFL